MRKIAIEGIDGSGKTTVADLLVDKLSKNNIKARSIALFREANTLLGHDIFELWDSEQNISAIDLVKKLELDAINCAVEDEVEILLFDRHWMSGLSFTENTKSEQNWKNSGLKPIETAYLRISPEVSLSRKPEDTSEAWMNIADLSSDLEVYEKALQANPDCILGIYRSDDTSPEEIAKNLLWDINIRR